MRRSTRQLPSRNTMTTSYFSEIEYVVPVPHVDSPVDEISSPKTWPSKL